MILTGVNYIIANMFHFTQNNNLNYTFQLNMFTKNKLLEICKLRFFAGKKGCNKKKEILTREGYNVYRRVTGKRLSLPLNMKAVSLYCILKWSCVLGTWSGGHLVY